MCREFSKWFKYGFSKWGDNLPIYSADKQFTSYGTDPSWLGYIGDEILLSYIGITVRQYHKHPYENQPVVHP